MFQMEFKCRIVDCTCQDVFNWNTYHSHLSEECIIRCPHCRLNYPRKEHIVGDCMLKLVKCDACGLHMLNHLMSIHKNSSRCVAELSRKLAWLSLQHAKLREEHKRCGMVALDSKKRLLQKDDRQEEKTEDVLPIHSSSKRIKLLDEADDKADGEGHGEAHGEADSDYSSEETGSEIKSTTTTTTDTIVRAIRCKTIGFKIQGKIVEKKREKQWIAQKDKDLEGMKLANWWSINISKGPRIEASDDQKGVLMIKIENQSKYVRYNGDDANKTLSTRKFLITDHPGIYQFGILSDMKNSRNYKKYRGYAAICKLFQSILPLKKWITFSAILELIGKVEKKEELGTDKVWIVHCIQQSAELQSTLLPLDQNVDRLEGLLVKKESFHGEWNLRYNGLKS